MGEFVVECYRTLKGCATILQARERIGRLVNSLPFFEEKAEIRERIIALWVRNDKSAEKMAMTHTFREMVVIGNEVKADITRAARKRRLALMVKTGREQRTPTIFYLCSYHQLPALDHAEYQGKIYVDRMWRSVVRGSASAALEGQIEGYLRKHEIKRLQWVIGGPVYLTTRPHCKHYFVPLATSEVLTSSIKAIKSRHMEARESEHRPISDRARYIRQQKTHRRVRRLFKMETTVSA